jgi:hypothetical protein
MDFKGDKIRSTPSFGGEVKPSVPFVDLWHVKEPYEHEQMLCRQNSAAMFLTRVSPASPLDVSGGRIRMTRIGLIMGLITARSKYLTITKTRKGGQGLTWAVVPSMMMIDKLNYQILVTFKWNSTLLHTS